VLRFLLLFRISQGFQKGKKTVSFVFLSACENICLLVTFFPDFRSARRNHGYASAIFWACFFSVGR